ncbi:MFS transporter [Kitasatospora sp. MMS16-BH015]|uniref:MFS transporter n=1 Tax=Kitasatospora sp. MMS16-BH015 TaxID=2018025 RepID=UPI000CA344F0|nr:MFS transporter [Kitasatospora sp. MMS16-BH015]AUG80492.1 MFS transporter [Kitasatospora sp. MMS16-BH015]
MPTPPPAPLRSPAFRLFFAGRLVSLLGSSMAPVAVAFAVLDAAPGRSDLGIVLAARTMPLLAFLLLGGVAADRFPRRTVLLLAHLGSALTQGAFAALLLTHHYTLLSAATLELLNGILSAFTNPALRGVVPQLVDRSRLRQANALLGSLANGTKIFGPSLAGLLVATTGSGVAIAADAASFLLAALFLARLPITGRAERTEARLPTQLRQGWREFVRPGWVLPVTAAFFVMNLVQTGSWQILGPQLTRALSSTTGWGLVLSVRGLGMLAMSTLAYRFAVKHLLRLGQAASVLGALPMLTLGLGLPLPAVLAAAFAGGCGSALTGIAWETSLQEHVPGEALSRVAAYDDLFSYLAIPVGQLSIGPLSAAFGGGQVATAASLLYAVAALSPLAFARVRALPHARPA